MPHLIRRALAKRILTQRCGFVAVGDSNSDMLVGTNLNPKRLMFGLRNCLTPKEWAGSFFCADNSGTSYGVSCVNENPLSTAYAPGDTNIVADARTVWPGKISVHPAYPASPLEPGAFTQHYQFKFGDNTAQGNDNAANFTGGSGWWTTAAAKKSRTIFYGASDSPAKIGHVAAYFVGPGYVDVSGSFTGATAIPANGFLAHDINLQPGFTLDRVEVRNAFPNEDDGGKILHCLGCRMWVPGVEGLEISTVGHSGWSIADWISKTTQAGINKYVELMEIDTINLLIGQNDTHDGSWRANVETVIGRWRTAVEAAGRTFMASIWTPWETSNQTTKFAAIAADLATIAKENADVSLFDLYNAWGGSGSTAAVASAYLEDGVHTTGAGMTAAATLFNQELRKALAGGSSYRMTRYRELTPARYAR